jgi:hypothetical protein
MWSIMRSHRRAGQIEGELEVTDRDRDHVLAAYPGAACVTRSTKSGPRYRIQEGERVLSNWCGSEERAWAAAAQRLAARVNDHIS